MKKSLLMTTLLIFVFITADVSAQDVKWSRIFGGKKQDWGNCVSKTRDDGFIIVGTTYSYGKGSSDIYVIKTDSKGNAKWTKTYGGVDTDNGFSGQQTRDRGYIIVGETDSFGAGKTDVYLIKTDSKGNVEWERTYGGPEYDFAFSVQQTRDRGYIIAGSSDSFGIGDFDIYVIKTDEKGNTEWARTFREGTWDFGYSVQETRDRGYFIVGYTDSPDGTNSDFYAVKLDSKGRTDWEKSFGGKGWEIGVSGRQASDKGYVIVGLTDSYGAGQEDVYFIKLNKKGSFDWDKTYGGKGSDVGSAVELTDDGGYIIVGSTDSFSKDDGDIYFIKTDSKGNEIKSAVYGETGIDFGYSVQKTRDDGYVIVGGNKYKSSLDVYLLKLEEERKCKFAKKLKYASKIKHAFKK